MTQFDEGTVSVGAETTAVVGVKTGYDVKTNRRIAILSVLYLLTSLGLFSWFLFDIWIGQHTLARLVRYDLAPLDTPAFRMIIYTVVGGGLGGTVNGIRSVLKWMPTFDQKHVWKYITAPWMGAVLAFIVYALLNSGVSVLGGGSITDIDASRVLAMFSVGALAGYGAHDVFIWMDAQVSRVFSLDESKQSRAVPTVATVPDSVDEDVDEGTNAALDVALQDDVVDEGVNVAVTAVSNAENERVDEAINMEITTPHLAEAASSARNPN